MLGVPIGSQNDADQSIGSAKDDKALAGTLLEGDRDRRGVKQPLANVLELHAAVHVEGQPRIHI